MVKVYLHSAVGVEFEGTGLTIQLTTPIEKSALIQQSDATRDARVRSCVDIPQSDPDPSNLTRGKTDRVLSELDCNVHQAVHPRCRRLAPS